MKLHLVHMITAVALALTAQAAAAAPAKHKNCTVKSHHHAQLAAAKPAKSVKWVGGGASAQMRRSPDIQILSFGP
jgi:hypothetical protein